MEIQKVLALDIGTDCIKAFIAEVGTDTLKIQNHGSVISKGSRKGEIFDSNLVANKIKQVVECTKFSGGDTIENIVVGISGMQIGSLPAIGSIAVRSGRVTREDLLHVENAAILTVLPEAAERLHMLSKRYRVDGFLCDDSPVGKPAAVLECEGCVVAASKACLAQLRDALSLAGLRPDYVVSNALMIAEFALASESAYFLLDMGAATTDFVIYDDKQYVRVGSLPIGSDFITEGIVQELALDFDHAERLKQYFGKLDPGLKGQKVILDCSEENSEQKNVSFDFLYNIIHNRVDILATLLCDTLQGELADRRMDCFYFTGGGSLFEPMDKALALKFEKTSRPLDMKDVPNVYRCPENRAIGSMVQYMRLQLAQVEAKEKEPDTASFLHKVKSLLGLH